MEHSEGPPGVCIASLETCYDVYDASTREVAPRVTIIRLPENQHLVIIEGMYKHGNTAWRIAKAGSSYAMGAVLANIPSIIISCHAGEAIRWESYKLVLQVTGPVETVELGHTHQAGASVWSYEVRETGQCLCTMPHPRFLPDDLRNEKHDAEIVIIQSDSDASGHRIKRELEWQGGAFKAASLILAAR